MPDFSAAREAAPSQLPVSSYFDEQLFRQEQEWLFQKTPRYVGHSLAVPEIGDFYVLPQENGGRVLLRTEAGVSLLSNVCRHRQALMLQGKGNLASQSGTRHIVCPLHRWTYSGADHNLGELVGAPHFEHNPCLHLKESALSEWNGLLFEGAGHDISNDLATMGSSHDLRFDGFLQTHVELHECNYNWKTFIEVYLEDYHVGPFHPGLGQFVTCDDLLWEFGSSYSVQTVGVANRLGKPGSPVYKRWHNALLAYQNGEIPKHGAIWLTYYPLVMVEWYPHVLTVSTLVPQGPQKTLNVIEFFYPEEIAGFEPDFIEAQRAAYMETCTEDDEIALRMDAGRKALLTRGEDAYGPYQSPMENGMEHFHQWYRRQMAQAGKA